jgi:hypothetical protein
MSSKTIKSDNFAQAKTIDKEMHQLIVKTLDKEMCQLLAIEQLLMLKKELCTKRAPFPISQRISPTPRRLITF